MRLVVHVDGGARGNPGPAAAAAVASDPSGAVVAQASERLGETTNNVAEYRGLLLGLGLARERGATEVEVVNDSELVAKQVNGEYRVRHADLRPLHAAALEALDRFERWTVRSVPRSQNAAADALVNRALDEAPAPEPVVREPGEGERLRAGDAEVVVKADGATTGGTLFVGEALVPPGPGPPAHLHRRLHDMFYVLEGTLTLRVGDTERALGPGAFACVPPGVPHTFANRGTEPVRLLNLSTPAGAESYLRELAAAPAPLTPEAFAAIAARHDVEPVAGSS